MPTYVAFIRAVNVAGHARVGMDEVRTVFTAAGCANVRSYIQSGNILFESPARDCAARLARAGQTLELLLGERPELLVRSIADLERIVERSPFARARPDPLVKRYVVFLAKRPRRAPPLPLIDEKDRLEAVAIAGREVFVVSRRKSNGFFGFPNAFVEAAFGMPATSRNWSTVTRLPAAARPNRSD